MSLIRSTRIALGAGLVVLAALFALLSPYAAHASKPKSPILIGHIYTAGTPLLNEVGPLASLSAGVRAIDAAGGVNGQPLKLDACNDSGDPNKSTSCAQKLVSDHVVATFADISAGNADAVATILAAAKIPQIDIIAASNTQFACATCYPVGALTIGYTAGTMQYFKRRGATKVFIAGVNIPGLTQITQTYAVKAAQSQGLNVVGNSLQPPFVADWAPTAAQISASGAQYVWTFLFGADAIGLIHALEGIGYGGKVAVISAYTQTVMKALGPAANGNVISWGTNPPLSASRMLPGISMFLKQLAAELKAGDSNANLANIDIYSGPAWASLYAFVSLAKTLKSVTAASVLPALKAQKKPLDMHGFASGGWAPGAPTGVPFPLANAGPMTGYVMTLQQNNWALVSNKSFNIAGVLKQMLGS